MEMPIVNVVMTVLTVKYRLPKGTIRRESYRGFRIVLFERRCQTKDLETIDGYANRERSHDRALGSFGFLKERGYVIISKEVKPTDAETAVQAIAKRIQAMVLFVLNGLCFT